MSTFRVPDMTSLRQLTDLRKKLLELLGALLQELLCLILAIDRQPANVKRATRNDEFRVSQNITRLTYILTPLHNNSCNRTLVLFRLFLFIDVTLSGGLAGDPESCSPMPLIIAGQYLGKK